jgi:hypothetical protein
MAWSSGPVVQAVQGKSLVTSEQKPTEFGIATLLLQLPMVGSWLHTTYAISFVSVSLLLVEGSLAFGCLFFV